MKIISKTLVLISVLCVLLAIGNTAFGKVSEEEAAKLKTTLTPFGAEKAGNKDGTIPEWTGGMTKPLPGYQGSVRTQEPFPDEKPLFSISSKNMDQYADKLAEGIKAKLKKYPDYRLDVYKTHRTAAAPQWVYDNTYKNALNATMEDYKFVNAYGGIPFPIPQNGLEAIMNHALRWRGTSVRYEFTGWMLTPDGDKVLLNESNNDQQMPYYFQGGRDKFKDQYWTVLTENIGPPIRAGEALVGIMVNPPPDKAYTYLTGQRRVRRTPNACCDTPSPFSAGISTFDEMDVFAGMMSLDRFDWKLVGKKEMYIPYNSNKIYYPEPEELLADHYVKPEYVRWELHRVWVVEATIKDGKRHTSPRTVYYIDEDSWSAAIGERYDANGQLWRVLMSPLTVAPDIPAVIITMWGFYNLLDGSAYVNVIFGGKEVQYRIVKPYPSMLFTPQSLSGRGAR